MTREDFRSTKPTLGETWSFLITMAISITLALLLIDLTDLLVFGDSEPISSLALWTAGGLHFVPFLAYFTLMRWLRKSNQLIE